MRFSVTFQLDLRVLLKSFGQFEMFHIHWIKPSSRSDVQGLICSFSSVTLICTVRFFAN